ncbi:MAG: YihY/virulence factor BrkB family protein [Pseudomonadota bacterium]
MLIFEAFRLHGLNARELAWRLYHELDHDDALGMAGQLAYFASLSIFPFLLFLLSLIAYLPIPDLAGRLLAYMSEIVPAQAMQLVERIIIPVVAEQHGSLLTASGLFSLWTASSAVSALSGLMNRAYDVPETRSWFKRKPIALGLTLGLSVFIIIALALLVVGPRLAHTVADHVSLGSAFELAWLAAKWPVVFIIVSFALAVLYYALPNVDQRWHWMTPGSVVATFLWVGFSEGFAYYVRSFASYNKIYGSLGAVVVLMIWLYLSGLALIIGAELNAEIHKAATGRDLRQADHP